MRAFGSVTFRRVTRPARHAAAHAAVHAALFFARRAPRRAVIRAGARVGGILPIVSRAGVRRSILHMEHATGGRIGDDARACVTVVARRLGENLADVLHAAPGTWPRVVIDGRGHLDAALEGGCGAVVVSAHHGPWELVPIALAQAGYRVGLITRPMRDPEWERMMQRLRTSAGVRLFPRGTPVSEVASWTSQGGVLGVALDQRVRSAQDMATFLGLPAPVVRGPVVIAQRASAALLACTARRVGGTEVVATMSPPIALVRDASAHVRRDRTTAVLARHLDVLVRRDLAQWVWWHERFSAGSRPGACSPGADTSER